MTPSRRKSGFRSKALTFTERRYVRDERIFWQAYYVPHCGGLRSGDALGPRTTTNSSVSEPTTSSNAGCSAFEGGGHPRSVHVGAYKSKVDGAIHDTSNLARRNNKNERSFRSQPPRAKNKAKQPKSAENASSFRTYSSYLNPGVFQVVSGFAGRLFLRISEF